MLWAFLAKLARLVVLSETGIARPLRDWWRLNDGRSGDEGGFAGVDASSSLAGGDEVCGALVGNDLEVVGSTGVSEVDGRRRPLAEDDGPLLLPHGDVLGVVVPVVAEVVKLSLKFTGDGGDDRIVVVRDVVFVTEEGECFVADEMVDLSPGERSDGRCVGHSVKVRKEWGEFMRG